MSEVILHHYALSPFAQKIRAILGHKGLAWRSVDIPMVMPKPDLTALTGGYRKTPVLQIGCDVYCDTTSIARVLDELAPGRPVYRAAAPAGRWLDHHLFFAVIALQFDPSAAAATQKMMGGAEGLATFARDRQPMMSAARVKPPRLSDARVILADVLLALDAQLAAGGPFLFGEAIGWADFCAYHPLWMMRSNSALAPQVEAHRHVRAWLDRIRELGHGESKPLSSLEALEISRTSAPRPRTDETGPAFDGIALGDSIEVSADDYAFEPSVGRLVAVGSHALAIERTDPRAGRVVVHFPRVGYRVKRGAGDSDAKERT